MLTLLIDADPPAYKFAARNEQSFDWDDGEEPVIKTDISTARDELHTYIVELAELLKADQVVVALTDYDNPNFRKAIFPSYKCRRGKKPKLLPDMRQFLADTFKSYIRPTLEADDVLGILATTNRFIKGEKIIVSIDKDLATIPGYLYNPDHEKRGVIKVSKRDAFTYFMSQVITGDKTDDYPGCPGAGPVAADNALAEAATPRGMWKAVVEVYENKGLTEEDAIVQARCARILHSTDYDFKAKRPILWTPPK